MTTARPRLLLVEDDLTTLHFLRTALRSLPAVVDTAGTLAQARALAGLRHYDLWLIDANLPDGRGEALLAQWRQEGAIVPAIAHTAARDAALAAHLLASGFAAVIHKPLSAAQLREAVSRCLPDVFTHSADATDEPVSGAENDASHAATWDDTAAARALNGSTEHVAVLRGLFLAELSMERDAVLGAAHAGEEPVLEALLHRLRASCGFVGAVALERAVRQLQMRPDDPSALRAFDMAVTESLARAPGAVGAGP